MNSNRTTIFLIGFSGSGKSSVGKKLASMMTVAFFDTDKIIEMKARKTIMEIFAGDGERKFRRMEREVVEQLLGRKQKGMIVALGGGAFESAQIRKMAQRHGIVVYLSCARRELYRRLKGVSDRPLLGPMRNKSTHSCNGLYGRLNVLLDKRISNYHKADVVVSTTGKTVWQAAAEIKKKLGS